MRSTLQKLVLALPMLLLAFVMHAQDLAVGMRTSVTSTTIGSQVTFTVVVLNEDVTAASGVVIASAVPLGSTYVSDNTGGAYDSGTGVWTVGSIAAGDSAVLDITVTVDTEGVLYTTAELMASDNPDPDSTPGNGSVLEDDWSGACITVPMRFNCRDDINVLATAQSGYTNYQWYLNGAPIAGADKDTYRIRGVGDYSYTASTMGLGCPAFLCCPISVTRDSCLSIGNLVFDDRDNNGLFNGTDTGINGVEVQLWSAGLDELKGTFDDVLDSTITTAGGGLYVFENLNPGLYYVKLTGTGVPTDFVSSTGGGVNDNSGAGTYEPATLEESVDDNDNGTKMSGSAIIMSDTIRLTLDGEPTNEDGKDNTNFTIDFGLYYPQCIAPEIITTFVVTVCDPETVDLAALLITDNNNVVGALSYFATANDAVNNTNPLSSTIISGVGSANYWIRKEGSFAPCYDTVSVVVTINAKPVYADGLTTSCEGTIVDLTSLISGYGSIANPTWTEGGNAVAEATQVTPSVGGTTYTLMGETAFGCKDTADVVVNVNPKPVYNDSSITVLQGASVDLTSLILDYVNIVNPSWTESGNAVADATNVTPSLGTTIYQLIGENAFGCKDTAYVTVTTHPKPVYPDSSITVCEGVSVDLTSLIAGYAQIINPTWSESGNAVVDPTQVNSSVGATTYTFIGENTYGYKDTADIVVTVNPKPVYADGLTTSCEGTVVDLTSLITNYSSIVNTTWTESGNAVVDATQVTPSVGSTTYTLIGETAFGCKDTADVVVTVNPKPVYADGATTVCENTLVDLTSLITGYGSIVNPTWTEGGNAVADATQVTPSVGSTTYTLIGETAFGCKDTADIVVTVNPKPVYADAQTAFCEGTLLRVDLTALITGYGLIVSPTWTEGGNVVADATQVPPSAGSTTYTLIGETAFGCKDTADVVIMVNANPVYNDSSITVLQGASVDLTSLILDYVNILNPSWTESGNAVADATNVTPSVGTTIYQLIGENALGCKDTAYVTVTIDPKPVYPDSSITVCEGVRVDLTSLIADYAQIINPTWTEGGNAIVDPTQVTPSVGATTYTFIGENIYGYKDTADVVVTVNPKPIYEDGLTTVCEGESVDLTTLITDYSSIINPIWTEGGNAVANVTNVTPSVGNTTYTLIGENASGCKDTADVVVTVNPKPVYGDATLSVCVNTVVDLTSLITGYGSIVNPTWTKGGNAVADATQVTPILGANTYILIGENASGCKDTAQVVVTVYAKPNAGADQYLTCIGVIAPSAYNFGQTGTWSVLTQPIGATAAINGSGFASNMRIPGQYNFELDKNGCKDTVAIIIPDCSCTKPDISVANSIVDVCAPTTVDVSAITVTDAANVSGTLSYHATANDAVTGANPLSNPVVSAVGTTTIWIRKLDGTGFCYDTLSVVVNIHEKPVIDDATITVCQNTVVDLTASINNYGSIVNPTWTESGQAVTDAANVTPSVGTTTYTLIGENASGCKDTADVFVTVYAKPNAGQDIALTCSGGSTPSTIDFAHVGNWTILSQPLGASASIDGVGQASGLTIEGDYTFELEVNGCKDTVNVSVQICLNLGDLVWLDANNNGIKDGSETGIPDIQVELYATTDNIKGNNDDVLIDTKLTDINGNYLFTDLNARNYYVKLVNIPDSLVSSTGGGIYDKDGAGDYEPSLVGDVNEEDHGTGMTDHMVMSQITSLVLHGEPTDDGDLDPNTNLTVDFGLFVPRDTPIFDLALVKKLELRDRGVVVNNGDTVRFNMTIYNQGNTNAYDVKISDYIPIGLEYNLALNTAAETGNANDWQADSTLLVGNIPVGQSVTVGIILGVNHNPNDTILVNKSEVLFATADEGSGIMTPDVDSQVDNDPSNDVVGGDDYINNDRNDEDDHDYAYVIDYIDHDPIGHIYCNKTGKVVTGGQISVVGPGLTYIIEDGSTGRYQFYSDGTPGTYTITYTHPNGYPMSINCLPQTDTLNTAVADGSPIDRDGLANGTILLGSDITGGYMIDKNCSANTYYLHFNITSGTDPIVLNNNIPVQCSSIGALTCKDNNYNSILDLGDTGLDSIKIYLEDCLTSTVIDSTISINGKYLFDGLVSGSYRVHAVLPANYRFSLQNVGGDELADSDVDSLGYSACITLNFGECDTSNAQICLIPNIYELALSKTLADGQSVEVSVGDTVTFNIKVKNGGSMDAYDLQVIDSLPPFLTLADSNWTSVGTTATYSIPFLAFGDSTTVSIKTRVSSPASSIINRASVRGSDSPGGVLRDEVTLDNNKDSVVISLRFCTATPDFTTDNTCATAEINFSPKDKYLNWLWNFGDGSTSTLENPKYTYAVAGNYTVTLSVTDSNGCTGLIRKPITVHPMVWAYAGIDRTICAGDSVNLHAQGGTHYIWTAGVSSLSDINSANPIATPSVTTTYVVQVSNDYGCFANATVTVNVTPKPVIVSRTGDLSTCTNGSMPVNISIDQPISSYEITGSAGWRNVVVSGNTITFDAVLNGSYNNMRVLLRGANGCSIADSFNLFLAGNPRAEFVVVEPFCNNAEMTLLFTGQATPAATLSYDLNGGVIVRRSAATLTRPYGDTTIVRYQTFGSKLVKLTVNDGGCIDESTKSIFVRKSPKTVISNNDTTICLSVCVNLYGTAGILDCVYSWTPATGLSATDIPNPVACPLVTTTYYLTIMDINGCQSTDSVKITVNNNTPTLVGVPANATVNCNSVPSVPTVTEFYGATVNFTETRANGNCTYNYTLTRTWTASDVCNRTTAGTQIVTVQDIIAPNLVGVPANITVACLAEVPTASTNVTAIDACDSNPTIGIALEVVSNETCNNRKTITRTWTATDACGNSRTGAQIITVFDNIAPVLVGIPANMTVSCTAEVPPVASNVTATDNCSSATPTISVADVVSSETCVNRKILTRTWTATDACGNTATAQQVITVFDNTAPVFTSVPADITIECDATQPNVLAVATDNCGSPTITVSNTTNGSGCSYTITRRFTATDACGNTATAVQTVTVQDMTSPTFTSFPANVTVACSRDIPPVTPPSVSDNCDQNPRLKMVETRDTNGCIIRVIRTWIASDVCLNARLKDQIIMVKDTIPPFITPISPRLAGLRSGDTLTMTCEDIRIFEMGDATATDNCDGPVVVNFEDLGRRRGNCLTDGYTLLIECRWFAVDRCGNEGEWLIFLKITDNKPPIFASCPANITVASPAAIPTAPTVTATDNCTDTVTVTMTETTVPTGTNCDYILTRTWRAVDGCGNFSTCSQLITVRDTFEVKAVQINVTCAGNDGSITMIPTQGVTFAWSDGATGAFRTNLAPGVYTVTATRGICQKVMTVTLGDDCNCAQPVASVQKTDATCGAANGTATIVVDNTANYNFSWSTGVSSTNTHTGLTAGSYNVTVTRKSDPNCSTIVPVTINNNTSNCCTDNFIIQSSLVKVITDCNSRADVCVEIPSNSIGSYTITDNGTPYAGGFGTCTAGSTLRFGNGNHTVIFTAPGGCKDTLLVKVTCLQEVVINRTITYPQTDSTCLTAAQLNLTGNIVSVVNQCAGNTQNTDISINPISQCIIYKALNIGVDSACLLVTTSTGGTAYVKLIITVKLPGCGSIIPQDSAIVTDACTANPKVCVNMPFDVVPDFNILLNGTPYLGGFEACKNDTTFAYTYFTIPGRGATGPYSLDYWTVNGTTHTAPSVNNMDEVVALMNVWDPTGHWMLSSTTLTIIGGDRNNTYSGIKLTRIANGSYGIMELNTNIVPLGTLMDIPRGHSTLVFINRNTGCADTLTVNAACLTPQYIESSVYVGDKDTMCIATNELMGTRYRITKLVPSTNTYARFTDVSGTTCVSRLGLVQGVEKATYVISDEFGLNDTTYVTTNVLTRAVKRPRAFTDTASTIKAQPVLIDVLSNDSLNTNIWKLTIAANPKHGEAIVTSDMRIIYTPDIEYCNSRVADVFYYSLCNIGGCDTATVEVTVSCDKVKIYNAFSPNNDGLNDVFVIEGIEKFKNNTVSVYNRWGTEVMKTKGYKNDWNGTWNNEILPDGTYFYIFEDGEGNKTVGYVQIMR